MTFINTAVIFSLCFDSRSSGKIPAGFKQQQRSAAETQTAAEDRGPPEERRSTAGRGAGGAGGGESVSAACIQSLIY